MKVLGSRCSTSFLKPQDASLPSDESFVPRITIVALCVSLLLAAPVADAQTLATKDPQAMAIAARSMAAMGGGAALAAADSLATGTLTLHGPNIRGESTFPIVLKTKGNNFIRVELQRSSGTTVRILNNGKGVIQRPDGTVRRLLMNNTFGERVSHIPVLSLLAEFEGKAVDVKNLPLATGQADSISLSVIPTTDPQQAVHFRAQTLTSFFVDQTTSFVTKMQYVLAAENDSDVQSQIEMIFSDYRNAGGLWVPFHQTTTADGILESDLVLDSVSFNLGLSDSEFTLPQ